MPTNVLSVNNLIDKKIQGHYGNVVNSSSGATRVDHQLKNGVNGAINLKSERVNTEDLLSKIIPCLSSYAGYEVYNKYYQYFERFFNPIINNSQSSDLNADNNSSKPANPECLSNIVTEINAAIKDLSDKNARDNFGNGAFASTAKRLENKIKECKGDFQKYFSEASSELSEILRKANDILSKIGRLNQIITRAQNPERSYDERDQLVHDLAKYIGIDVKYGPKGQVIISDINGNAELVSQNGEASQVSVDLISSVKNAISGNGKTTFYCYKDGLKSQIKIDGGAAGGIVNFIENAIPELYTQLEDYVHGIAKVFNNSNSCTVSDKGLKSMKGIEKVKFSDVLDMNMGTTTLGVVDDRGISVNGMLPREFDFSGKTVKQIVQEINEKMHIGPQGNHINIGGLTNVRLSNTTLEDNQMSFGIEFENSDVFSKNIHVTAMRVIDSTNTAVPGAFNGNLPGACNLDPGKTGEAQNRVTANFAGGNGINYKVEVTFQIVSPDTGEVKYCTSSFPVNLNNHLEGQFYSCDSATNSTAGEGGANVMVAGHAPLIRARLVDESGSELSNTDDSSEGYLIIGSASGNKIYGFDDSSSEDEGLIAKLGLSHIFEFKKGNALDSFKLRSEFETGELNLNTSSIVKSRGINKTLETSVPAQLNLVVDQGFGDAAGGDTISITVNGVRKDFTFGLGDGNIYPDNNTDQLVRNIVDFLNKENDGTASFSSILTFAAVGNAIQVRSKFGGSYPQNIRFDWNFANATINGGNNFHANLPNVAAAPQLKEIQNVSFDLSPSEGAVNTILKIANKKFNFEDKRGIITTANIKDFGSMLIGKYKNTYDEITLEMDTSERRLEDAKVNYDDFAGIDNLSEQQQISRLSSLQQLILAMMKQIAQHEKEITNLIIG